MDKKINVCGETQCYDEYDGMLDEIVYGYGHRDEDGNITWYDGYKVIFDKFHRTIIYPANENGEITSIFPIVFLGYDA